MPEDTSLLQQLIRDLSAKVDTLPTRHELDALNATVADFKAEFNRFVLVSEFNTYRDYADQRHMGAIKNIEEKIVSMVPRFDSIEGMCEDQEERIHSIESDRTPAWLRSATLSVLTGLVSAIITAFASHQLYPPTTTVAPITTTQVSIPTAPPFSIQHH